MNENFYALLQQGFNRRADSPCLIVPGTDGVVRKWRYGEVDDLSSRIATVLQRAGVATGDRVLVQIEKSAEAVGLYLACLRMGAVYVPINTAYTEPEVDYFLRDAQPAVFVCPPARATPRLPRSVVVLTLDDAGGGSLLEAIADCPPTAEIVDRSHRDLAAIVYTSGTTGRSKGAMLSHGNLTSNAVTLVDCWGWCEDDVLLHALPIFHVHGLFVALHCAMLQATPMIFLAGFDAAAIIHHLPAATVLMGVPTFYTRLLNQPELDANLCQGMRLFISGSAPLTETTFNEWERRTGHRILERYGMSETLMNTSNPLYGERLPGTVGYPLPGVQARVANTQGVAVAAGEVGVIEVKGPNVFTGYWQMPDKTAEEFRKDGFFITGDLATMMADGRVTIVGREKDLIISGGYNIYPKEIEKLLDEIPGIVESAVIGVAHGDFGEAVVAVVVPVAEPIQLADIDASLAERLARFKQPKEVINVSEQPRNAMGKVQKKQLREEYAALFVADAADTAGTS